MAKSKQKIILAQFGSASALLGAAREISAAGYTKFDCHSPFPIHGMNNAMKIKRSSLSVFAGLFALIGLVGAYYMQYWMSAVNYPLILSGKPFNSYPSDLPVAFALTVLLAAFASFFGMMVLSRLPRFNHLLFSSERFKKSADNGFFISVESDDPQFDRDKTSDFLIGIGGRHIEVLEE